EGPSRLPLQSVSDVQGPQVPALESQTGPPALPRQPALSAQSTHAPLAASQLGMVGSMQSAPELQLMHMPLPVSQMGPSMLPTQWLRYAQRVQKPDTQLLFVVHWLVSVHSTQLFVVMSQWGATCPQSVSTLHPTGLHCSDMQA